LRFRQSAAPNPSINTSPNGSAEPLDPQPQPPPSPPAGGWKVWPLPPTVPLVPVELLDEVPVLLDDDALLVPVELLDEALVPLDPLDPEELLALVPLDPLDPEELLELVVGAPASGALHTPLSQVPPSHALPSGRR
jgi:hypothetical protein